MFRNEPDEAKRMEVKRRNWQSDSLFVGSPGEKKTIYPSVLNERMYEDILAEHHNALHKNIEWNFETE